MIYRENKKPRRVFYIDVSNVPIKHLEWFLKGVQQALKQNK